MAKKPMIAPRKPTRPPDPVAAAKFLEAADKKAEPEPMPQPMAEVHELRKEPEALEAMNTEPMPAPKPEPEVKPTEKKKLGRRVYERKRDGRKVRQTTVYLDPALAKKLAYHCIEVEQDQSMIINEALRLYLASEA